MNTEASRHTSQTQGSRPEEHKFSLRTRSRIINHTQSSTTCMTVYPGKISLKKVSSRTLGSTKNITKSYSLNLKYEDIVKDRKNSRKIIFQSLFCSQPTKPDCLGCQCDMKCLWMDRWMGRVTSNMHCNVQSRQNLLTQQCDALTQIEKDLRRTQPKSATFQDKTYLSRLRDTLVEYSLSDPEVGYMQGMNIIASVPVYHSKSTYEAARVFEMIMKKANLRAIYLNDLTNAKQHCQRIMEFLKNKSYELYKFLVEVQEVEINIFIIGWLFSLMGSFIPLQHMHLVLDAYIERGWAAIYAIIFTLLVYLGPKLMAAKEQTEIMIILSIHSLSQLQIDWQQIIQASGNVRIIEKQVYHLHTIKSFQ